MSTTVYTPYHGKLFKDVFQKTRSKPCKRHGFWETVAPTQELSEGKIQVAAVYNLREQVLVQIAGGEQRALSGVCERGRGVDDIELQERNSMAEKILQQDQRILLKKSKRQSETVGRSVQESQSPNMKQVKLWQGF